MQHPYAIQIEDGRLAAYSSGANPTSPVTQWATGMSADAFTSLLAAAVLDDAEAPTIDGLTFEKRDHEIAIRKNSVTVFNLPWPTVASAIAEQGARA